MNPEAAMKLVQEEEDKGDDGSQRGRFAAMSAVETFELMY
jgi:hypothetical protein